MNVRQKSAAKNLLSHLNDLSDRDTYLSRRVYAAMKRLQDELEVEPSCDDFGRCNCQKGFCDKGLRN